MALCIESESLASVSFEFGRVATSAHLHGQSVSMVRVLLEDTVGRLDGLFVLSGFIQLDELPEGGAILAPQWLRHCVWIVAERAKLRRMGWSECLGELRDHGVGGWESVGIDWKYTFILCCSMNRRGRWSLSFRTKPWKSAVRRKQLELHNSLLTSRFKVRRIQCIFHTINICKLHKKKIPS